MNLKFIIDKEYDRRFAIDKSQKSCIDEQYRLFMKYMKYSKSEYQKCWNEINDDFSDYVEKETGYKWFYKTYYCVISTISIGISNWGMEPIIVRWWYENPYTQRKITAHELILSHYFEIYLRHYKEHKLTNGQIWALAEIAAYALTSLRKETKRFWPWDIHGYDYNHNYPQLIPLQKKLKDVFMEAESFDDYMKSGIKMVKRYKNINP